MGITTFDLNLLKVFVAVAENGGFTKAAEKLFIEQPSVTRAIQRLEGDVGPLFQRTKRRVQLTTKGADLLVMAKNILVAGEDFLVTASNKEAELSGSLKFAAASPLSSLVMPEVIRRVSIETPKLWPMMFTGITDDIIRRIKNRELEFGIFFYEGNHLAGLDYKELTQCDFKVVAAKNISKENLNSFIGSREVNETNTASLPTFSKLKKMNKALQIKYSANDLSAYRELLLKGVGIGLLPEFMIRSDLKSKRLRALHPELRLIFPIWVVSRQGYPLSLEAQRVIALSLDVLAKL